MSQEFTGMKSLGEIQGEAETGYILLFRSPLLFDDSGL